MCAGAGNDEVSIVDLGGRNTDVMRRFYTAIAEVRRYPGLPKDPLKSLLDVEVCLQTECPSK
jgi:hypothetical protein